MNRTEQKNINYANSNQKEAGIGMLISDKIKFKTQNCCLKQRTFYNYKGYNL